MSQNTLQLLSLELFCPAKINLALEIAREPRHDGYHNLNSLMQMVSFGDTLRVNIHPGTGERLTLDFAPDFLGLEELQAQHEALSSRNNLLLRASELYFKTLGIEPKVALDWQLTKRIPLGSGLGGGSSDATAALRLLNAAPDYLPADIAWPKLTEDELLRLATELGADPPFFLMGPTAVAQGIGEELTPQTFHDAWYALLFLDKKHRGTPESFRMLDSVWRDPVPFTDLHDVVLQINTAGSFRPAVNCLQNDFNAIDRESVAKVSVLLPQGAAEYINMTGTGPTVFAIFNTALERDKALALLPEATKARVVACDFLRDAPRVKRLTP